jgi:hypothetical protein
LAHSINVIPATASRSIFENKNATPTIAVSGLAINYPKNKYFQNDILTQNNNWQHVCISLRNEKF